MVATEDTRPWVGFDWSGTQLDYTFDGVSVAQCPKFEDLLAVLAARGGTYRLACEASFESFNIPRRQDMAAAARSAGHEIFTFKSTNTDRVRRALGYEKEVHPVTGKKALSMNEVDSIVIYKIATTSTSNNGGHRHLTPLLPTDASWTKKSDRLRLEYMQYRRGTNIKVRAREARAVIGTPKNKVNPWSADFQKVMGTSGDSLLSVVTYATKNTSSRQEFERLLGLHGSAYPSIFRSEVFYWSYRGAKKRDVTLTVFRREIRNLRSRLIAAGVA